MPNFIISKAVGKIANRREHYSDGGTGYRPAQDVHVKMHGEGKHKDVTDTFHVTDERTGKHAYYRVTDRGWERVDAWGRCVGDEAVDGAFRNTADKYANDFRDSLNGHLGEREALLQQVEREHKEAKEKEDRGKTILERRQNLLRETNQLKLTDKEKAKIGNLPPTRDANEEKLQAYEKALEGLKQERENTARGEKRHAAAEPLPDPIRTQTMPPPPTGTELKVGTGPAVYEQTGKKQRTKESAASAPDSDGGRPT